MAPLNSKPPGIRAQRRARKHARILAAARALLHRHSHEHLSLRQVARRARVSPAGMYEFFQNREHLIDTLAAEANEALTASLRAATAEVADPVKRLVELGMAYIAFAQERPTDFWLLFGRRSTRRSLAEDVPENSEYMLISAALADLVGRERPGGVHPRHLEMLAYHFWSTTHGMAMLRLTHLAGFDADFDTAHRLILEHTARTLQPTAWTSVAPSPDSPGRE